MDSAAPCKLIWTIENLSSMEDKEFHRSDNFVVDGCTWYVSFYPKGVDNGHLKMYLQPVTFGNKYVYDAEFSLAIFNQKDHKKTVRHELSLRTFVDGKGWGFSKMLPLSDFHDPDKGFIVNDTCILQVEISSCSKVANQPVLYPNAGKPFQEEEEVVSYDENSEIIGGFSILRRHVCLYKKIWSKYGHIATTKVMPPSSYHSLVTTVTDIMNSIVDMYCCPLIEVSSEMIIAWESKISLAEKLQFNISWLRSRVNDVKRDLNNGQIQALKVKAEHQDANSESPKVKVKVEPDESGEGTLLPAGFVKKNEPDESRESLPGFVLEGML